VKAWLEEDGRMELKFLPPYAPKLNPVEVFNQTLKCRSRMATAKDSEGNKKLAEEHLKDCSKYGGARLQEMFRARMHEVREALTGCPVRETAS
ncbi:MAG: hypothetical protein Q3Y13_04550, partial [Sutterella sp.]|nr:hypothetical protein [Sutterella sp.]